MLQSQANAAISKKALEDAREQLGLHQSEANEKTKKVLMALAGGNAAMLRDMCFVEWHHIIVQIKREKEIRKEYAEEIDQAEKRLQDYILSQTEIMRKMINKRHLDSTEGVLHAVMDGLVAEWKGKADRLAKEEEMKALEARMAAFSKEQSAKSKKVLGRLNAGTDQGLMTMCFTAWVQFIAEYNKNRAFEDAVKAEEKKIAEFMKKQNEGAKSVLGRMSAATDSGLVQACFKGWVEFFTEQKKAYEMEHLLNQNASKFGSFAAKNKASAGSAMDRAAAATDNSTLIVIFWYWKRETKVERMKRYARDKNQKKKQQLIGVKGLFKNFANELEAGLKDGTPRVGDAPK